MKILKKPIELRAYQQNVLVKILDKNSLVILPTGTGKTFIALALVVEKLKSQTLKKILIMAPSKPLVHQHFLTFSEFLNVDVAEITGSISPNDRENIYKDAKIIVATPQTIENDLITNRLDPKDFSLVVFDEAHHAVSDYSYVFISKFFQSKGSNPQYLGLTASPGSDNEKINEVISNLFIKHTEIRSETDGDIKSYIMEKQIEYRQVELPEQFLSIKKALEAVSKKLRIKLKKIGFPIKNSNKKDLLLLQGKLQRDIANGGEKNDYFALSFLAQLIKVDYAIELLETQGVSALFGFFERLKKQKTKAARSLLADNDFKLAYEKVQYLFAERFEHPKIQELIKIIKENEGKQIIIFSQYRATVELIMKSISEFCVPVKLIGQKEGMTQKQQQEAVEQFRQGKANVLICTSIGEEGLDIPGADLALFFEAVPSEIRAIQRAGRVGRHKIGRLIVLLAKGTRDEAYFWSAYWKKKRMERTINILKDKENISEQQNHQSKLNFEY